MIMGHREIEAALVVSRCPGPCLLKHFRQMCLYMLQGAWDNNGMADFHSPVGGAADEAQLQRALESMLQV